jgi:hypothetical protein
MWHTMNQKSKRDLLMLILLTLLGLGFGAARATTFLQFQSTYLGGGRFQYQMNVFDDPFFTEADITGLDINFTNEVDSSTGSTNWVNTGWDSGFLTWASTNGYPSRPYQETFLIQSSEASYKLETNNFAGAIVLLSLYLADFTPPMYPGAFSQNIVGYANMPCLIPCTPDEADNSPTNYVFTLKLLPDVNINQLIQTNENVYGVNFTWNDNSTFLLQGTTDLNNWTNVAYIWSWPPETVWTTNQVLNNYGNFFRVELVADGHSTNLPPLNSALVPKPKAVAKIAIPSTPRVTGCQFSKNKVLVTVTAQAGQTVQVQAVGPHRTVQQTQQVVTQGTSTTVSFNTFGLPNPVYFQATAQ